MQTYLNRCIDKQDNELLRYGGTKLRWYCANEHTSSHEHVSAGYILQYSLFLHSWPNIR